MRRALANTLRIPIVGFYALSLVFVLIGTVGSTYAWVALQWVTRFQRATPR